MVAVPDVASLLRAELEDLSSKGLRRVLREISSAQGAVVRMENREFLNFSSNDYLGLAADPQLIRVAQKALEEWGVGSGASRLVCGSLLPHHQLEEKIASYKREGAARVFSSGFAANLGAVQALIEKGDTVWVDRYAHASLIDAARLCGAKLQVFPHLDYMFLRRKLKAAYGAGRHLILTDSIFSMDGDAADLKELLLIKGETGAMVLVDEAHALGVYGPSGRGLTEECGVEGKLDAVVGTFSKSFGGQGGFVAGSAEMAEWLTNRARTFVYSTASSPVSSATSYEAVTIAETDDSRRRRLWRNVEYLRRRLQELGFVVPGEGPIAPVVIGDTDRTMRLAERLFEEGILAPGIRPPTVPKGTDRIRLTVSALHTFEQIDALADVLRKVA